MRRLEALRYIVVFVTWMQVLAKWSYAVATKLASIVKTRADGITLLRFVMDLLRSGVNGRGWCRERVALPRLTDFVNSALDIMVAVWSFHGPEHVMSHVGFLVVDFSDAFYLIHAAPKEQGWLVFKCAAGWAVFQRICFGMVTAPLIWGRVAAAAARIAQATFAPHELRVQMFVDDPAIVIGGPERVRRRLGGLLLLLWTVMGLRINWPKGQWGKQVEWIGTSISLQAMASGPAVRCELTAKKDRRGHQLGGRALSHQGNDGHQEGFTSGRPSRLDKRFISMDAIV